MTNWWCLFAYCFLASLDLVVLPARVKAKKKSRLDPLVAFIIITIVGHEWMETDAEAGPGLWGFAHIRKTFLIKHANLRIRSP